MNKDVVIIGNNKKICQQLKSKLRETGVSAELQILLGKHLDRNISRISEKTKGKQVVLVFKNEELKNVTELFHTNGITNLYVFPWDTHCFENENSNSILSNIMIPIDNSKPRLDYVEAEVSGSCNLNCKGCFQFSNLVEEKTFCDLNVFRKDLKKLKDFFWGIGKIRLLGGEPLINPDFLQFVMTAREIFPDSDIRLVSNGLLITKLTQPDLETIKNFNCTFDISDYPPTHKKIDEITDFLNKAGVAYTVSLPIKLFYKCLLREPLESPNESFNNCLFTHCHALGDGYLAACSHQFYISRLNSEYNLEYPENDKINIYQTTLTGWEINNILESPHDFCRYCSKGMVPIKWKTRLKRNAKPSDWIVERNFTNMKVVPVIQKILKLFAKKLRYFKQKPKNI